MASKINKVIDWKTAKIHKSEGCEDIKKALNRYFPGCGTAKYLITKTDIDWASQQNYMVPKVICIKADKKNPDFETLYNKACKRLEEIEKPAEAAYKKGWAHWSCLTNKEKAIWHEWKGLIGIIPTIKYAQNNPGVYVGVTWDADPDGVYSDNITDLETVEDRILYLGS